MLASIINNAPGAAAAFIVLLSVGVAGYFAVKNESAKAADKRVDDAQRQTDHWRNEYGAEHTRAVALENQVREQRELKHAVIAELNAQRMKTDLTGFMKQVADAFASVNTNIAAVEKRLTARMDSFVQTQQAQTRALEAMVERLNNGGTT